MSGRGVNRVTIIGHLGADPEAKYLASGSQVTNIRVAVTEKWKDKATGEAKEHTEWLRIAFFGKLAEIAGQYLTKGSQVYVEGKIRTRKWQADDGTDRYSTEIIADQMQMLDSKPEGGRAAPQQRAPRRSNPQPKAPPVAAQGDFDDDIPF